MESRSSKKIEEDRQFFLFYFVLRKFLKRMILPVAQSKQTGTLLEDSKHKEWWGETSSFLFIFCREIKSMRYHIKVNPSTVEMKTVTKNNKVPLNF